MFKVESNLIKRGNIYTAVSYRTYDKPEFLSRTGMTRNEFDELSEQLLNVYSQHKAEPLGEYMVVHYCSSIEYVDGYIKHCHYGLLASCGSIYQVRCNDYKFVLYFANALGIEYKQINSTIKSEVRSSCYLFTKDFMNIDNFVFKTNKDHVLVKYKGTEFLRYHIDKEEIEVVDKTAVLSASDVTYISEFIQNINQQMKFMFDYVGDEFAVITA